MLDLIGNDPKTTPLQLRAAVALSACNRRILFYIFSQLNLNFRQNSSLEFFHNIIAKRRQADGSWQGMIIERDQREEKEI